MIPRALFVGITTLDFHYMVEDFPSPNSKTRSSDFNITTGGPATNAAATFADLGGSSYLLSAIGENHVFSKYMINDLEKCGIRHTDLVPDSDQLPSIASVITPVLTGERTIVYSRSSPDALPANLLSDLVIEDYDLILVDGMNMKACIKIATMGKQKGIPVVLDGGSWKERMEDLLPFITYAICSDDFYTPESTDHLETMNYLLGKNIQHIAITRGKEPVLFQDQEGMGKIPVPLIKAIDTLGAGDVFHGAFSYAILKSGNFRESLQIAARTASDSCLYKGARSWMHINNS